MLDEIWKAIEGWEQLYSVSNYGRVYSHCRGRLLRPTPDGSGYLQVDLRRDGIRGSRKVADLVARAFLGSRPNGKEINHIDGDKANNRDGNLEYVTHAENMRHADTLGLRVLPKGEKNHNAKLTNQQTAEIRRRYANKEVTQTKLGLEYGVTHTAISYIVNGHTYVEDT